MTATELPVFALILAAGTSSRFGSPKQLAEFEGKSLIARAAATASQVCSDRVIVIAGANWRPVVRSAAGECPFFALNDSYADGIGSSLANAARLCRPRASAMLLMLADQPLITATHLQTLLDTWSGNPHEIVATAFAGTLGPPVLFPAGTFPALTEMNGDTGARALLRDERFLTVSVTCEDAATDIDQQADLHSLR